MHLHPVLVVVVLAALAGCTESKPGLEADPTPAVPATTTQGDTSPAPSGGESSSTESRGAEPEPRTVAQGLEVPWGIAFLPDGSALIAERDGATIQRLDPGGTITEVGTVPDVVATSEGGLLGLAVSPTYDADETIYAYVTTAEDNRVLSITYDGNDLGDSSPILTGIPAGQIHDGGRIAFGPDGKLYVTTGETGDGKLAQDSESLGGKILRIEADGSIPVDNPDPDSPIWTTGHRNVQGIDWDDDGRLWATEFGSAIWDEVNLIEPGNNYGWPEVEGISDVGDFTDPLIQWKTSEASPSGLAYFDGNLYVAALYGKRLFQIPVSSDGTLGTPKAMYNGAYGRLRTVVVTPQDTLWFTTSNHDGRGQPAPTDDRIFEIRP
ncbi:MAG: PQQ-dependent sugar dehydrogenase [Nocardioidaceae bacterium]|nr:PQQ-dependent sugar dehydrogenase [Nocardioidaceae bacterium]